jgi:hypothetical protein
MTDSVPPAPSPSEQSTRQNRISAARAALGLSAHLAGLEHVGLEVQFVDLLIDLRHLALVTGCDYTRAARSATLQFLREVAADTADPS